MLINWISKRNVQTDNAKVDSNETYAHIRQNSRKRCNFIIHTETDTIRMSVHETRFIICFFRKQRWIKYTQKCIYGLGVCLSKCLNSLTIIFVRPLEYYRCQLTDRNSPNIQFWGINGEYFMFQISICLLSTFKWTKGQKWWVGEMRMA